MIAGVVVLSVTLSPGFPGHIIRQGAATFKDDRWDQPAD